MEVCALHKCDLYHSIYTCHLSNKHMRKSLLAFVIYFQRGLIGLNYPQHPHIHSSCVSNSKDISLMASWIYQRSLIVLIIDGVGNFYSLSVTAIQKWWVFLDMCIRPKEFQKITVNFTEITVCIIYILNRFFFQFFLSQLNMLVIIWCRIVVM